MIIVHGWHFAWFIVLCLFAALYLLRELINEL